MSRLGRGTVAATFARSLVVQGSWNYHTMLGTGFAFAMLPGLRRIYRGDPDGYREAVQRHLEHFNAHPYLTGLALGAVLRMESEGADPETVRRFKSAVRGPLGSLGDRLVWATWLPLVAVTALVLYWSGVPTPVVVVGFLVIYNAGHLALRVWALRAGLASGQEVAGSIGRAGLGPRATRLQPLGALALGALAGVLLGSPTALAAAGPGWIAAGFAALLTGLAAGHRAWRPAAVVTICAVALLASLGVLR